jgi:hypothetical protein
MTWQVWEMRDKKHERLEEKKTNFTQMLKGNIKVLPVIFTFPSRWEMRDKESIGAVNEGTLQCESIQRLKQRRGRLCARERNDKVLLGLANGREGWPTLGLLLYFIFFIFKPNRFGLVRVGRFRHTKTGNQTGPDIFLNILTGSISFLYRFGFFG